MTQKSDNKGSLVIGMISGVLLPVLVFAIIFLYRSEGKDKLQYLRDMHYAGITPKLLALSLLPNLILFYGFLRADRLATARGVVFSLFVHGIVIALLKIF